MYQIPSGGVPTAHVCINKSRLKIYHKKNVDHPTSYYLKDGQEFQIELFNPLSEPVVAKIEMNGKQISGSGIVIKPGQRVFLERYIDKPNKFKFETYEVNNTAEVANAIKDNGDLVVSFYREFKRNYNNPVFINTTYTTPTYNPQPWHTTTGGYVYRNATNVNYNSTQNPLSRGIVGTNTGGYGSVTTSSFNASSTPTASLSSSQLYSDKVNFDAAIDYAPDALMRGTLGDMRDATPVSNKLRSKSVEKSIETGRVEAGSASDQKFTYITMELENWPFYQVSYKLLPVSRKLNTSNDIQVKQYCTNCGKKYKSTDKFCANCGQKI